MSSNPSRDTSVFPLHPPAQPPLALPPDPTTFSPGSDVVRAPIASRRIGALVVSAIVLGVLGGFALAQTTMKSEATAVRHLPPDREALDTESEEAQWEDYLDDAGRLLELLQGDASAAEIAGLLAQADLAQLAQDANAWVDEQLPGLEEAVRTFLEEDIPMAQERIDSWVDEELPAIEAELDAWLSELTG